MIRITWFALGDTNFFWQEYFLWAREIRIIEILLYMAVTVWDTSMPPYIYGGNYRRVKYTLMFSVFLPLPKCCLQSNLESTSQPTLVFGQWKQYKIAPLNSRQTAPTSWEAILHKCDIFRALLYSDEVKECRLGAAVFATTSCSVHSFTARGSLCSGGAVLHQLVAILHLSEVVRACSWSIECSNGVRGALAIHVIVVLRFCCCATLETTISLLYKARRLQMFD